MELLSNENNLIYNILKHTKCNIYYINNYSLIIDYIIENNNTIYFIFNRLHITNINEINNLLIEIGKLNNLFYNYKIIILTKKKIKCYNYIENIFSFNINILINNLILYLYKNNIYLYDKDNDIIMI